MNLRRAKDGPGWEPDFPDGVSFLLLADLREAKWGIYEFTLNEGNENWRPSEPVSDELARLIWSGKRYPPALALARDELARAFASHRPNKEEFARAYADAILSRLSQQAEAPYFLARALGGDGIDLTPGEWYWILRIQKSPVAVYWVSDDYFIYQNPLSDFELTNDQVDRLWRR